MKDELFYIFSIIIACTISSIFNKDELDADHLISTNIHNNSYLIDSYDICYDYNNYISEDTCYPINYDFDDIYNYSLMNIVETCYPINYDNSLSVVNIDDTIESELECDSGYRCFDEPIINHKIMFIGASDILVNPLYNFVYNYPCNDNISRDFKKYVDNYPTNIIYDVMDKIVDEFIKDSSNDFSYRLSIYINFVSHMYGCNIYDGSILRSKDIDGGYNLCSLNELLGITCKKDFEKKCYSVYKINELERNNMALCNLILNNEIVCNDRHFKGTTLIRNIYCIDSID